MTSRYYTEAHEAFRASMRRFVACEIAPFVDERDEAGTFPREEMGAISFVTARLMETWSHGLDVVDVAAVERPDTDRLRHVVFLGIRTRDFSYVNRDLLPNPAPVYVELTAPSGATWTHGVAGAADRITGSATDFCRVVTQRRHVDDTDLVVTGPAATEWMRLAQAFAGPPGPGRAPGLFPKDGPQ